MYPDVILGATYRDVPQNCGVSPEATGWTDALHGFFGVIWYLSV